MTDAQTKYRALVTASLFCFGPFGLPMAFYWWTTTHEKTR